MKQRTKIIWSSVLAIVLVAGIGCKKFLDRKPQGVALETDITQGGLEDKVYGLYGSLRNWGMSDLPRTFFKSIRSDDAVKGSTPGDIADAGTMMNDFQYSKDHWLLNANWDDHFSFVYLCNEVIKKVDSLQLTDPASIINKAEASFLRAYSYFDLIRDYGEVPKIDFPIYDPADANKPKATVPELYALVDADLAFAAANLPVSWETKFIGRATKGAANGLWAKTKLYRKDWAGALAKSEEVMANTSYALLDKYYMNFKEKGENSSESLFEIQMYVNNNGTQDYGNSYNQTQGLRGSGDWDLGWGFNVPAAALVNSYETGDPRRDQTILFSGQSDGGDAAGGYGLTLPSFPPLDHPYWNKKVYSDPVRRAAITTGTDARFNHWTDIPVLRFADVILMAAEAANELGGAANQTKALTYLEKIRARARNGNNAVLPPVVAPITQTQLRTAIIRERRAEFAMEGERFYDLVRWDSAVSVLGSLGYTAKNKWYPIPQANIDRSGGKLIQNPDYP